MRILAMPATPVPYYGRVSNVKILLYYYNEITHCDYKMNNNKHQSIKSFIKNMRGFAKHILIRH